MLDLLLFFDVLKGALSRKRISCSSVTLTTADASGAGNVCAM